MYAEFFRRVLNEIRVYVAAAERHFEVYRTRCSSSTNRTASQQIGIRCCEATSNRYTICLRSLEVIVFMLLLNGNS